MPNSKQERVCQVCGRVFMGRADAKTCSDTCRQRLHRAPEARYTELSQAVEAELVQLGARDSVAGMQAMALANLISGKFAVATGVAAISKELSRVMDEIRLMSSKSVSPLDQLLENDDDLSDY